MKEINTKKQDRFNKIYPVALILTALTITSPAHAVQIAAFQNFADIFLETVKDNYFAIVVIGLLIAVVSLFKFDSRGGAWTSVGIVAAVGIVAFYMDDLLTIAHAIFG